MQFQTWKPGLAGLIFLPRPGSSPGDRNRPYFIADINEKGQCKVREGPMIWKDAYERIKQLATQEQRNAFSVPIEKRLQIFRSQGYLHFSPEEKAIVQKPETPKVKISVPPQAFPEKSIGSPDQNNGSRTIKELPSPEVFDALFDKWANEALQVAKFPAQKPEQGNRVPIIVKRKVAQLCEMKICVADSKPACFRIVDSKKGEGGPYNWFSYYSSIKTIVPNWEYLVQIAAFRDLIFEYGYSPDWMKFEYKEFEPISIFIDIGIKIPAGPKIFVEVKEAKAQWEILISGVKAIGTKGVDLSGPDRGNDPLRKAKYIVAGRPDFFVGYSAEGFKTYKVKYESDNRFTLQTAALPDRLTFSTSGFLKRTDNEAKLEQVTLIKKLLSFIQAGFRNPIQTFQYLKSRDKCFACENCLKLGCQDIFYHFQSPNPWDHHKSFFEWCWKWYPLKRYEEHITAALILPLVARFMASEMRMNDRAIGQSFRMEFKGKRRIEGATLAPPCLWKGNPEDTTCIRKAFGKSKMLCCDFLLLSPFPRTVVEVKAAAPHQTNKTNLIFKDFEKNLRKCEEWLKADSEPGIRETFRIECFDYALSILVDLTEGQDIGNFWKSTIDETELFKQGILACLISPRLSSSSSEIITLHGYKEAAPPISTPQQHPKQKSPFPRKIIIRPADNPKIDAEQKNRSLETALEAALRCEETEEQQGVEVPLTSWGEVHQFKIEVISHIQNYNRQASKPIKHASPWAWRIESGGHPLTENGRKYWVEMRCSFFPKGNKL